MSALFGCLCIDLHQELCSISGKRGIYWTILFLPGLIIPIALCIIFEENRSFAVKYIAAIDTIV